MLCWKDMRSIALHVFTLLLATTSYLYIIVFAHSTVTNYRRPPTTVCHDQRAWLIGPTFRAPARMFP